MATPAMAQPSPQATPVQGPTETILPGVPSDRSAAPAGETNAAEPANAPPWQDGLLGSIGGLRVQLDRVGVSLGLLEQSEALGNVTGGLHRGAVYEGVTSLGLGLDTQRAGGWPGGTFNVTAFQYHGRGLTQYDVPGLTAHSGVEQTVRGIRLFELWYEQLAWNGTVALRIGQLSVDQEFMTTQYGGLFINAGFGFPTLASADLPSGGVAYPLATPGLRLKVVPDDRWAGLVGVFNGNPAGSGPGDPQRRDGSGTAFRVNDGVFAVGEVQYTLNQGDARALPGLYKLGAWYQSGAFADPRYSFTGLSLIGPAPTSPAPISPANGTARGYQGDYSLYGTIDQLAWRKPTTKDGGVGVFLRVMAAPPDRNLVDAFVQAGVTDKAPFAGRDNDTVGIGATWSHIGNRASKYQSDLAALTGRPMPERHAETVVSLTYQAQLAPWLQVQPTAQYTFNPAGGILDPATGRRVGDALIFGFRTSVTF